MTICQILVLRQDLLLQSTMMLHLLLVQREPRQGNHNLWFWSAQVYTAKAPRVLMRTDAGTRLEETTIRLQLNVKGC